MTYKKYMKRCIELAKKGMGLVSPNPLVGCIVLGENGNVISTGYHKQYGGNHAERDALLKLKNDEARGGTLIVNLEPCSHYGKTPPCADLIIERGLKRVVTGMRDVNPIVSGRGIKKIKAAGIEVIEGVLEDECRDLNEIFIKNMIEHKTFVAIKTAITLDGKIATSSGNSKWITSDLAREKAKALRTCYDAILTSSNTVIADNPLMMHRKKIILDRNLRTDFLNNKIYQNGEILVFFDKKLSAPELTHINFIPVPVYDNKIDLEFVLQELYKMGIMSVLIEAGGRLCGSALDYTDKIYQFIAPKIAGDNSALSCFDFRKVNNIAEFEVFNITRVEKFSPDILITLKRL